MINILQRVTAEYDDHDSYDMSKGMLVLKKGRAGFIDKNFNVIIPLVYESLYMVDEKSNRFVAQKDKKWLLIDRENHILFESSKNYDASPLWKINSFDSSYCYIPYLDGYFEHFTNKIVVYNKSTKKEFLLYSDSAICVDDSKYIYFFDGEVKGFINLENGHIQRDILFDARKKGFRLLDAYKVDEILCIGAQPYGLFDQEDAVQELRDNGITAIINLMQESEMKYNRELFAENFELIDIPLQINEKIDEFILQKILHSINKNEKTYLHSHHGVVRVESFLAFYLHEKFAFNGNAILQKIKSLKK